MIRAGGPRSLKALSGQKIGVLAGTTTEQALHNTLQDAGITADVIPVKTHADGLAMLDQAKISAYFGDRSILISLIAESKSPAKLMLAENYLSVEPYALGLPHGDEDFRLAVDRALSHIYRGGDIASRIQGHLWQCRPRTGPQNAVPDFGITRLKYQLSRRFAYRLQRYASEFPRLIP